MLEPESTKPFFISPNSQPRPNILRKSFGMKVLLCNLKSAEKDIKSFETFLNDIENQ